MDIGQRITELRKKCNLSTNKLANLAGVSQSYLREVELGQKNPTVEMLSYICFGLNISLQDFFTSPTADINPFLLSALKKLSDAEQTALATFITEIKKTC